MNYSLYISQLKDKTDKMWLDTIISSNEKSYKRAFSDEVETDFWKEHSKVYDKLPSLFTYAPQVFDDIVEIIGINKNIIELGAGTGQFTIPMSKVQKSVIAVDFSKDMLNKLEAKAKEIDNIKTINCKIEEMDGINADVIFGVNCIYRILDMKSCINNLRNMVSQKILFVWTMQRSIYDAILNSTHKKGILRKQEYIHIVNLLYDMGIDCDMKIKTVFKDLNIDNINENYNEIMQLSKDYNLDYIELVKEFNKRVISKNNRLIYRCEQKIAFISFDT